jgi:alpha-L-arabinofuranosidase
MARGKWTARAATAGFFAAVIALGSVGRAAVTATLDVDVAQRGAAIPPLFYGLMTEEINHSYDGGLLAELIQNRTFQDDVKRPAHWSMAAGSAAGAKIRMDGGDPVNGSLPVSLRLDLGGGHAGVANDGYWGIPIRPDTRYTASFFAKAGDGFAGPVTAALVLDAGDAVVAHADTQPITDGWQRYTVTLTTGHDVPTTSKAKFTLSAQGNGCVWFSLVSLFPPTYQDTPAGLRPDLMKLMADLHPAFIRLPGGNYLEGDTFPTRFDWKKEIGPVEQRPGHMGCWGYRASGGFGLPQYLLWCRQLHAEPILAVFAGYTLNHDHVNSGPDLDRYVEEALEEIEYVSGPADSVWGKRRAADGLAEPFHLTYVEIGNEDWFDGSGSYDGRYTQFYKAIKAKYPGPKLIATAPVHSMTPDLYDDHYYRSARQMAGDWEHYHHPTESAAFSSGHTNGPVPGGTKIFCGEWATQEGRPTPDLNAGLADAVWLMGLERDSETVQVECYAPLLVNVNPGAWQWPTNLIGYDAMTAFGSPSYYAQAMFGQNKGNIVLPAKLTVAATTPGSEPPPHGAIGVGTWHTRAEYKDITVTAPNGKSLLKADLTKTTDGWNFTGDKWDLQDGAIKPAGADSETWGTIGDTAWTDYTLRLKARKTAGKEGFLILFHATDAENYTWLNVGGWGNSRTQMEIDDDGDHVPLGPSVDFKVATGRWYDIRIEVRGRHVGCFIDDKLICEATVRSQPVPTPMYATATYADDSHELILKVVNLGREEAETTLNLKGAATVEPVGKAWVLSGDLKAVNTVEEPTKVAPREEAVNGVAASFKRTFPPHSLTLLRIKTAG